MKSTQFELEILELIKRHHAGIANYEIAKKLNKDPAQTHRKLQKMAKHNIILKIPSKPVLYKIDFRKRSPVVFLNVQCPKCKSISTADYNQLTKVCENPECINGTGNRTRFFITNKTRVVGSKVI